jgi:hypothetical protein
MPPLGRAATDRLTRCCSSEPETHWCGFRTTLPRQYLEIVGDCMASLRVHREAP